MKHLTFFFLFLFAFSISNAAKAQEKPVEADTLSPCKAGINFLREYQYEKALQSFQSGYNSGTLSQQCLEKMAYCQFQLGRLEEAKRSYLQIIEKDTAHITALNYLGNINAKQGRFRESLQQYLRLIELDSANSVYHKQAAAMLKKQNKDKEAIIYYSQARQLNPHDITVIAELAKIYEDLDLLMVADTLVAKGLALDSTSVTLLLLKTNIDYQYKNYKGVLEDVARLMEQQVDTSIFILKVAGIASYHQQEYEQSVKLLQEILDIGIESEYIHYYLGLAYRSLGNLERSAVHFEQAVKNGISENISTYYTNLAISREEQQNYKESIKAYQSAYKSSRDQKLLFHLARNYDAYYLEKNTALLYYEKFLTENGTGNPQMQDYSKHRIGELKETIHFDLDTLN